MLHFIVLKQYVWLVWQGYQVEGRVESIDEKCLEIHDVNM